MITEIYDRIIMLKNRKIIADGTQSEVLNGKNLSILFDMSIHINKYKGFWQIYRQPKEQQSIE